MRSFVVGQIQFAIYFEPNSSSGRLQAPRRKITELSRWTMVVAPCSNRHEIRTVINMTFR